MISYFKYTDGSAFTLSAQNYKGMFNVMNGVVTTGETRTLNSMTLSSKGNFLSRIYERGFDFDITAFSEVVIDTPKVYPRTILTITNLLNIVNRLDENNLLLYSKMITYNSNLLNTICKTPDNTSIVFCLTSASVTDKLSGLKLPVDAGVRFPMSQNPNSSYYVPLRDDILRSTGTNSFIVTQPNNVFKYYTSNYVLSGAFNSTTRQTILTSTLTPGTSSKGLFYNKYSNILYNIIKSDLNFYNIHSFYSSTSCLTASFFDQVDITKYNITTGNKSLISFGKRYRAAVVYDQGRQILEISKVNLKSQILTILPSDFQYDVIFSICQRFEDDIIAIYGYQNGVAKLTTFDVSELVIGNFNPYKVSEVINSTALDTITFSPFDSNIIIFTQYNSDGSIRNLDWRSISNATYPILNVSGTQPLGFIGSTNILGMPAISAIYVNMENVFVELGVSDVLPHIIYDVQFDVTNNLNSIIFYRDSYETYSTSDIFKTIVPLNMPRYFVENFQPGDSSLGITFNDYIRSVVKDTYNLYINSASRFAYNNYSIISTTVPYLLFDLNRLDLQLYDNESFNVGVLSRIVEGITEIQKVIASTLVV